MHQVKVKRVVSFKKRQEFMASPYANITVDEFPQGDQALVLYNCGHAEYIYWNGSYYSILSSRRPRRDVTTPTDIFTVDQCTSSVDPMYLREYKPLKEYFAEAVDKLVDDT